MFFLFPYFTPKLVCFLFISLLVCPCAFFTYFLVEYSFFILECQVLSVLLDSVSVSFKSLFFRQYLPIYLPELYCSICLLFCFCLFRTYSRVFFLSLASSFVVLISLSVFPVQFSIQVLNLCSCSLGAHRFYHRLISPPHRSARLNPWFFPSGYLLVIWVSFQFLPSLFSSLGFWEMVM